ncbi:MAG: hypothetical protein RL369_311, partial [Pseudomonadota bacterium]
FQGVVPIEAVRRNSKKPRIMRGFKRRLIRLSDLEG